MHKHDERSTLSQIAINIAVIGGIIALAALAGP